MRTDSILAPGQTARTVMADSLGSDPYERLEELRKLGAEKAEAEGVAYQLQEERKAVLSRIASEYAEKHPKASEAALTRMARADERYHKHLKGTGAAIEKRDRLKAEYWALSSELEWDRASLAHLNRMVEMDR